MITVETDAKIDQEGAHFWMRVVLTIDPERVDGDGKPDPQVADAWLSWCGKSVMSLRTERDLPKCEMCHRQFNAAVKRAKARAEQEKDRQINEDLAKALEAIKA